MLCRRSEKQNTLMIFREAWKYEVFLLKPQILNVLVILPVPLELCLKRKTHPLCGWVLYTAERDLALAGCARFGCYAEVVLRIGLLRIRVDVEGRQGRIHLPIIPTAVVYFYILPARQLSEEPGDTRTPACTAVKCEGIAFVNALAVPKSEDFIRVTQRSVGIVEIGQVARVRTAEAPNSAVRFAAEDEIFKQWGLGKSPQQAETENPLTGGIFVLRLS